MKTERLETYRVSERVLLSRGDVFRAKGGPLWKCDDGTKTPLAAKGPFVFLAFCRRGQCEWVEAIDKAGAHTVLHIAGRRRRASPQIITRPYVIVGKKRPPKKVDAKKAKA